MIINGRFIKIFGSIIGFAIAVFIVWIMRGNVNDSASEFVLQSTDHVATPQTLEDPLEGQIEDSFSQVLTVFANAGTPAELERAIETLDTLTRLGKGVTTAQHAVLLSAMERGTPAGMSEGSWSHLFNSACNVLAVVRPPQDEDFIKLLERVAVDDPRLVMRLYALQHLGISYNTTTVECQLRSRELVQRILAAPASQTAGTALVLWRRWEQAAGPAAVSAVDLGRSIVKDANRQLDVRVSALQAFGDDPGVLDLARAIAPDITQPVILRKAALNLIGRHGHASDLAVLRQCSEESPRLAQAGNPAAVTLEKRLNSPKQTVLFQIQ